MDKVDNKLNPNEKGEYRREGLGGYPCPVCGSAVHITLYQLMEGRNVICGVCGFRIDLQYNERSTSGTR